MYKPRGLSIDTDLSNPSSVCSSITATTKISINPKASTLQSLDEVASSTRSILEVDDIITKNAAVCMQVRDRVEKQKSAITQLEILKLKSDVRKLKSKVCQLSKESRHKENLEPTRCEVFSGPSIPSHKLLALKEKLKEVKMEVKDLKSERDWVHRENFQLKSMIHEKSGSKAGSCEIF